MKRLDWILPVFGIIIITSVFWGGYELGSVKQQLKNHEESSVHARSDFDRLKLAYDQFVPRSEIEGSINDIREDIAEIKKLMITIQTENNENR